MPPCGSLENHIESHKNRKWDVPNPADAWDEEFHPWLDLCEIAVDRVIEDNATVSVLTMAPNRSPQCIKIPLVTSADHYASLGHARAIEYPAARKIRRQVAELQENWMQKAKGKSGQI